MLEQSTFKDIADSIDKVVNFLSKCQQEESDLKTKQKNLEREIQDVEHELEFRDMTRSERSRAADKIKELRTERRYAKNMLELLEPFLTSNREQAKIIQSMTTLSAKTNAIISTQNNRTYNPRTQNGKANSKIIGKHFVIQSKPQDQQP